MAAAGPRSRGPEEPLSEDERAELERLRAEAARSDAVMDKARADADAARAKAEAEAAKARAEVDEARAKAAAATAKARAEIDAARAQAEAARAQAEADRLSAQARSQGREGRYGPSIHQRWRTPVAVLLVVLGCLLAPLALVAVWTNSEVSDTETYVATVAPLAEEPAVQDAVAERVTTEIFTRLDIHGITSQAVDALVANTKLPPLVARQLQGLVGTMTQGIQSFVESEIRKVVASDEFARLWVQANQGAHQSIVKALSGQTGPITVKNDVVSLQLGPLIQAVKKDLTQRGFSLASSIPAVNPSIELFESRDLVKLQTAYTVLNRLSVVLPILSVLFLALGVFIARGHRRMILGAGLGVAIGMALLALVIAIGRAYYLNTIPPDALPTTAAAPIFDTLVRFLSNELRTYIAVGLVVAAGAFMMGPSVTAVRTRSWLSTGIGWVRAKSESLGLSTGSVGVFVYAHETLLRVLLLLAVAVAFVVWSQPTVLVVIVMAALVLVGLAVIDFLGREPSHQE